VAKIKLRIPYYLMEFFDKIEPYLHKLILLEERRERLKKRVPYYKWKIIWNLEEEHED